MIRNKVLWGRAGLRGSSWGLKGWGWGKKFSPSCGAGQRWAKKNPCGAGAKIPSFGPARPIAIPTWLGTTQKKAKYNVANRNWHIQTKMLSLTNMRNQVLHNGGQANIIATTRNIENKFQEFVTAMIKTSSHDFFHSICSS